MFRMFCKNVFCLSLAIAKCWTNQNATGLNPSSPTKCLVQIIFLLDKKYALIHNLKIPSLNGGILANKIMLPASFERLSIALGF